MVHVFDGRGREFLARIDAVRGDEAVVVPLEQVASAAEPATRITIAQAVLKADHMDEVVRDVTMMGGAAIAPVVSARAETSVAALQRGRRVERWTRIAIAAAKQSRRAVVPSVDEPRTFERFVDSRHEEVRIILVEPSAGSGALALDALAEHAKPASAVVAIGPEGGWGDEEIAAARAHGFTPVVLGARTFRADATPVIALAVLQYVWKDL